MAEPVCGVQSMKKAVIFDLDNTLYDYDAADKPATKALAEKGSELLGVPVAEFSMYYEAAKTAVKARHARRAEAHNRMLFCQHVVELLGKSPLPYALELYETYWDVFIENMEPYDGVVDFMKALKEKGLRIAVCTDMMTRVQYRKLRKMGMAGYIDCIVTSEEARCEKPNAVLFQMTLDKLKVLTQEAVFIGDNRRRDVQGALWNAIQPIWFVADRDYEPEEGIFTVKSYRDPRLAEFFELS